MCLRDSGAVISTLSKAVEKTEPFNKIITIGLVQLNFRVTGF